MRGDATLCVVIFYSGLDDIVTFTTKESSIELNDNMHFFVNNQSVHNFHLYKLISRTAERIMMNLDRQQVLKVLKVLQE